MKNFSKFIFVIMMMFCFYSSNNILLASNESDEVQEIKEKLPKLMGGLNNEGKDFWFSPPPCYTNESNGGNNFIKIFVVSQSKTSVTVEIPGKDYNVVKTVNENEVQAWDLNPGIAQTFMYDPQQQQSVPADIYEGAGIHVYSKTPIIVYVMVRFIYTSDGWCAIPTSSLGKDYVVASYTDYYISSSFRLPSVSTITAAYDNTKVTIKMGGSISGKSTIVTATGKTINKDQTHSFILQRGDVFSMMPNGSTVQEDITGTRITANKPVSVVSGHMCTDIPVGNHWCDYTVESQLPTETWGTCIPVPKIPDRTYPGVIRLFAKEDNTTIYRDGTQVAYIQKGSGVEGTAWLEMRVVPRDWNTGPRQAIFTADKPFSINYFNPGTQEDQVQGNPVKSDPFNMVMVPIEQFQNEITLSTPAVLGGQNFKQNNLNLVYELDTNKSTPFDLEFGECNGKNITWYKVSEKFPDTFQIYPISYKGKYYATKYIKLSNDGVYKIRCKSAKFTCYSFGFGDYDSYAYPSSMNLTILDSKDTLSPIPTYIVDCDGNVENATVVDRPFPDPDLNRSNLALLKMDESLSYNYDFEFLPFEAGTTTKTNWNLRIMDPKKEAKAVLTFTDKAGNDTTIVIEFLPKLMELNKSEFYGFFKKTDPKVSKEFTLTNLSTKQEFLVDRIILINQINFSIKLPLNWNISEAIKPGESRKIEVEFDPSTMNDQMIEFKDSLLVLDTCWNSYRIQLSAATNGALISVDDLNFGKVNKEVLSVDRAFSISNKGNEDLIISKIFNFKDTNRFQSDVITLMKLPFTLKPSESKIYNVTFNATKIGKFEDQMTFISNSIYLNDDNELIVQAEAYSTVSINEDGTSGNPILFTMSASPNPFGESTEVKYNLAGNISKHVEINLVNSAGQKIETLVSQTQNPGEYSLQYNAKQLAQGTYYLIANVSGYSTQLPVIIAK